MIARGMCSGPRLLVAGQPITRVGGHCHQWGGVASDDAEIRLVVQRQAERGCDLVKVMATGGVRTPGTNPADAAFTTNELRTAVDAASAAGLKLAAHAHGVGERREWLRICRGFEPLAGPHPTPPRPQTPPPGAATATAVASVSSHECALHPNPGGIRACVDARVHSIEHCSWVDRQGRWGALDENCATDIARAGIFVSPTVPASWGLPRMAGMRAAMGPAYQRMVRAGVRFVASSDAGAIPNVGHHQLVDGLLVFGSCAALSSAELLRAATSEAAAACMLGGEVGCVAEGLIADLLVVPGNPLAAPEAALRGMVTVVCRGRLVEPCQGPPPKPKRSLMPSWTRAAVSEEPQPCACTARMWATAQG
jgi:imidazolonepropionase-like amidohydrolase